MNSSNEMNTSDDLVSTDQMSSSSSSSSNVYTAYNEFSKLSADNKWQIGGKNNDNKNNSKKPVQKAQVFSSYNKNGQLPSHHYNNIKKSHNNQQDFDKKILRETNQACTKKQKFTNESHEMENFNTDLLLKSDFIGMQTFASSASSVFSDFIERVGLTIVCLDSVERRPQTKSKLCFKGKCRITLIHGEISINGYDLKSSKVIDSSMTKWYDLYSAETNSFLSISTNSTAPLEVNTNALLLNERQREDLLNKLQLNCDFTMDTDQKKQLNEFLLKNDFTAETSSLIVLQELKSQMCNYLSYYENFHHIYQAANGLMIEEERDFDSKLAKMGVFPVQVQNFNAIKMETSEEKLVADDILNHRDGIKKQLPVTMACGGKDVGKSTLLRYLINSLLNKYSKVAYIDCDPGQCEFTLSGCISLNVVTEPLFGPPHTHIAHTSSHNKSCYFLGHLTPSDGPAHYMQCLRQCHQDFLNLKDEHLPLVINTMGWNQGLGLCLLKETILLFRPTHLIQINHPIEANKNMPILDKNWLQKSEGFRHVKPVKPDDQTILSDSNLHLPSYKLLTLKSQTPYKTAQFQLKSSQKRFSSRDHRTIAILAYFSRLQEPNVGIKPVHHLKPYKIRWSKLGVHISHAKVDYDELFRVFNAALVGLCQVDSKHITKKKDYPDFLPGYLNSIDRENKNAPVLYKCLGFGIIRGINMETNEFYILTPDSIENLNQVNLLVKGMLNTPTEFFFEQDSESPCPYLSLSDSMQSGNKHEPNGIDLNAACGKPIQRKYLIHQAHSQKN
jgi:polynucleotide 5'-hydroxyl-kinase GRC3/NOL9